MLSTHTLVITAIAVPYFGGMAAIFWYLAAPVRQHEPVSDADPEHDPADLRLAA